MFADDAYTEEQNYLNRKAYLRSLTDSQLARLFRKILERIEKAFQRGTLYGIDLPTLSTVEPYWAQAYLLVRHEGYRRTQARKGRATPFIGA